MAINRGPSACPCASSWRNWLLRILINNCFYWCRKFSISSCFYVAISSIIIMWVINFRRKISDFMRKLQWIEEKNKIFECVVYENKSFY